MIAKMDYSLKVGDFYRLIHGIAPFYLQESYDNSGLLTGKLDDQVHGVIVSLDMTEEVLEEAIRMDCNLVIAHHPIIFRGLKRINGTNYVERTIIKAIKHNIALLAVHTNLDNILTQGVNQKIAEKLNLKEIRILIPKEKGQTDIGTGCIGVLPNSLSSQQFLIYLKEKMGLNCIRYSGNLDKTIRQVALCGGAGSSFLPNAIEAGAEAYVSADFKYHEFFDAEDHLLLADIGHYESEVYTIDLLFDILVENFPNFAIRKTSIHTNPIKYFT